MSCRCCKTSPFPDLELNRICIDLPFLGIFVPPLRPLLSVVILSVVLKGVAVAVLGGVAAGGVAVTVVAAAAIVVVVMILSVGRGVDLHEMLRSGPSSDLREKYVKLSEFLTSDTDILYS